MEVVLRSALSIELKLTRMTEEYKSPEGQLDETDKGDDAQRRFRYQAAFAASLGLSLLAQELEVEAVFCEHHEDILVKRRNNLFDGIQVKTRLPKNGPFVFGDKEIMHSLERFVKLEDKYTDQFRRYVICSNCDFFEREKNSNNLVYCLDLVRMHDGSRKCFSDLDFSKRVEFLSTKTSVGIDAVLRTLAKVWTQKWADIDRFELVLADEIARLPGNGTQRFENLKKAADQLISLTLKAASLHHEPPQDSYTMLLENPDKAIADAIIKGKRLTAENVRGEIDAALTSSTLLQTNKPISISDLPKGMRKMEMKLAMGGFTALDVENAKNLKHSMEVLMAHWIHKYGTRKTEEIYQHLNVVAMNICGEEYLLAKTEGEPFGEKMLINVNSRLQEKYDEIREVDNEILYEHLKGVVCMVE
jgi:hypothetical protein